MTGQCQFVTVLGVQQIFQQINAQPVLAKATVSSETVKYRIAKAGPSAGTPTASTTTSIVSTVNSQHRVVASPRVRAPTVVTQSQVPTGQQTGIVTFPNDAVSSAGDHHIRHSAHGIQTRPLLAGGPTVFINHSGSRFSVPLHALKNRQTGKFFCQFFGGFFC